MKYEYPKVLKIYFFLNIFVSEQKLIVSHMYSSLCSKDLTEHLEEQKGK